MKVGWELGLMCHRARRGVMLRRGVITRLSLATFPGPRYGWGLNPHRRILRFGAELGRN